VPSYSSAPWTSERITRGFVHIVSQTDKVGIREVVALVDGGDCTEANAALICAAPEMASAVLTGDLDAARAALATRGLT
jgi:hypothetical protein